MCCRFPLSWIVLGWSTRARWNLLLAWIGIGLFLFPASGMAQTLTPIRVVYSQVRIRSGPSTSYTHIGWVYSGQVFVPTARQADSTYGAWYRIPLPSTSSEGEWGWVAQRDIDGTVLVVEDSSYSSKVRTIMNDEGIGWRFRTQAGTSYSFLQDSYGNDLRAWNGQPWVWVSSASGSDTCDWYSFYVPYRLNSLNWQSTMWLRNDAVRPAATIEGYVRDPAGRPVSGVSIDAYLPDFTRIREVTTDSSGFYRISLVPPCRQVNLDVSHPNYLEQTVNVYNLSSGETRRQDITIEPALPDLIVTFLSGPSSGQIGGQIAVQANIRNQGYISAGSFRLGFYFSTDPTITLGDVFSGYTCSFSGLSAGNSATCSGNIGVPSSLSPGTYYLGAIVDDIGQVTESNEGNNARAADSGPITLYRSNNPPVAAFVMCANTESGVDCKPNGSVLSVTLTSGSTILVGFSGANSSDPDGDPLSYRWQIDGVQVSTDRDFSYNVGQGTHNVLLTVTDSHGASSQATGTIVVNVQSCTYTISPASASFGASGGSGTVSVSAPLGCSWTAVSNVSWISIVSGASGSGNGTVTYSVASNNSASSRTGTLTIAGQTFTVYQSGTSLYTISGRVRDGSGNPIPGVTLSDSVGHTATTDSNGSYALSGLAAGMYTITPSKSGYTFSPPSRTVSVPPDATGLDFVGTNCQITVAPSRLELDPQGGEKILKVTTNSDCSWQVEINVPWITLLSPDAQRGPGMVILRIDPNLSLESREGSVQIGGQIIQVFQQGIGCGGVARALSDQIMCRVYLDIPPTTPSFYINYINDNINDKNADFRKLGMNVAEFLYNQYTYTQKVSVSPALPNSRLIILDFGAPAVVTDQIGMSLFQTNRNMMATITETKGYVDSFISGYITWFISNNINVDMPILIVGIGTNNSGDQNIYESHGKMMAKIVNELNQVYSQTIDTQTPVLIVGAIDSENTKSGPYYSAPITTAKWYTSYLTNSSWILVDFGNPHWDGNDCSDNCWTENDVRNRVNGFGLGRTGVVGQVYTSSFVKDWKKILSTTVDLRSRLWGVMTQWGACEQKKDDPSCFSTFSPITAYNKITNDLGIRPRWLTDIRWLKANTNPPVIWGIGWQISIPQSLSFNYLRLQWSANDSDGDYLIYEVSYIPQPGREIVLGTTNDTNFTVDLNQLPGSSSGRFMITAFDGFHFVTALSEPLWIPEKPPSAWIIAPSDGAIVRVGYPIELNGEAADPELGMIPEEQLVWSSDRDGILGYGRSITINNLSVGIHIITLRATDLSGQVATAQIRLVVAPYQIYLPIISK